MKESIFNERHVRGKRPAAAGTIIPRTTYQNGMRIPEAYSEIPEEIVTTKSYYRWMNEKPSKALALAQEPMRFNILLLTGAKTGHRYAALGYWKQPDGSGDLFSKKEQITLLDLQAKTLYSNNVYSSSMHYLTLALLLEKNEEIRRMWNKLDYSLRHVPEHAECYLENNQIKNFGMLQSALTYETEKLFRLKEDTPYLFFTATAPEIEEKLRKSIMPLIDLGAGEDVFWENVSSWIHEDADECQPDGCVRVMLRSTIVPTKKNLRVPSQAAKATAKAKDFFSRDWSMMDDEEAKKIPAFLQMERLRCRQVFEENKDTIPANIQTLIQQIYNRDIKNISFSGPAGTGKTTYAEIIAGAPNLPFQLVVGKAGVDSSVYFGYESIVSHDGASQTRWHDGNVTQAARYGALLLFDEINLTEPEIIGSMNTLLDNSRAIVLDNGEVVKAHPNFTYIEAMNIGSGYDGTSKMNNSHVDRCERHIRFGLFSQDKEILILKKRTGYTNDRILKKLVQIESIIRQRIEDPSTQFVSIRRVEAWIKEAKYTGEWVESSLDTMISPLCLQDETCQDFEETTIARLGGLATHIYQEIKDLLEDEEY